MAWTAPRTWVAGEVVTAATMNTHIRDNEKEIWREIALITDASADVAITGTGTGSANVIATDISRAYDGSPVRFEITLMRFDDDGAGGAPDLFVGLFDSTTVVQAKVLGGNAAGTGTSMSGGYEITPSVGNHTYNIRGYMSSNTGHVRFPFSLRILSKGG